MSGNHPESAGWRRDLHLDGAAWLALRMANVMNLRRSKGPTTDHHLTIYSIGCEDGGRFDTVGADGITEHREGRGRRQHSVSRIHLLQGNYVGAISSDG